MAEAQGHRVVTSRPTAFAVSLNIQAEVYVVDPTNWSYIQGHRPFHFVDGGRAVRQPVTLRVPRAGTWWIVVVPDAGTTVRYSIAEVA